MRIPMLRRVDRRVIRLLAVTAFVSLVLATTGVLWVGGELTAPARSIVGTPPHDLPAESVRIPSESGELLSGWFVPADGERGTILLLHGNRGSRLSMLNRARLFWNAGYSVLLIDLQAHGESPGTQITAGFRESNNVRSAVEYLKSRTPGQRIGIVGVSLGGAATLLASPLDVDAVVLEAVYTTIEEAIDNRIRMRLGPLSPIATALLLVQLEPRLGVPPSRLRPIEHIGRLGCPVMVMAGDCDRRTTIDETRQLFERANEPKELVVFKGAEHVDLEKFSPRHYADCVLPFMNQQLRRPKLQAAKPRSR